MKKVIFTAIYMVLLTACSGGEQETAVVNDVKSAEVVEQATAAVSEANTAVANEVESAKVMAKSEMADDLCLDFGPQTPRDITNVAGLNTADFPMAPPASELNLCNIHTHTNAEHKGPGFSVFVNDTDHGGYACNGADSLTAAELAAPSVNAGKFKEVKPGDTIEVHWVHTSCDVEPGEGLGSCLSDTCADPLLRVEAQVFLVVNDENALDFNDFAYAGNKVNNLHQALSIPSGTGQPVLFRGSTTGPSYTQSACSPVKVTWNVRPQCTKLDINSLNEWAVNGNVFNETKSHGVRQLVTAPELLSPIQ